jgi:hypothetical protein
MTPPPRSHEIVLYCICKGIGDHRDGHAILSVLNPPRRRTACGGEGLSWQMARTTAPPGSQVLTMLLGPHLRRRRRRPRRHFPSRASAPRRGVGSLHAGAGVSARRDRPRPGPRPTPGPNARQHAPGAARPCHPAAGPADPGRHGGGAGPPLCSAAQCDADHRRRRAAARPTPRGPRALHVHRPFLPVARGGSGEPRHRRHSLGHRVGWGAGAWRDQGAGRHQPGPGRADGGIRRDAAQRHPPCGRRSHPAAGGHRPGAAADR